MTPNEYLFSQLAEEANEVAHCAHKILHFGVGDKKPGQDLTNAEKLIDEAVQLIAVWTMLIEAGLIRDVPDHEFMAIRERKVTKVMEMLVYSQSTGVTSPGIPGEAPTAPRSS